MIFNPRHQSLKLPSIISLNKEYYTCISKADPLMGPIQGRLGLGSSDTF